jgi:DNA-binding CsgD family transcriptional regulator
MATITCITLWLLTPLIALVAVIYWLSETEQQRIRRWRAAGKTQKAIAEALGISTYRVRKALA